MIDRRPEINYQPEVSNSPKGHLPTWARVPLSIFSLAGISAIDQITSHAPNAEAAAACNPNKKDYNYTILIRRAPFFDVGGKDGIFDLRVDPWLEMPVTGGTVKAVDPKTKLILSERNYSVTKPNIPNFTPKKGEENLAWSVLQWTGECDIDVTANTTDGKSVAVPGKKVLVIDSQDEKNDTFEVSAVAGGNIIQWHGRRFKTAEQFLAAHDKNPALARDLSPQTLQNIRDQVKKLQEKTAEQKRLETVEKQLEEVKKTNEQLAQALSQRQGGAQSGGGQGGVYGIERFVQENSLGDLAKWILGLGLAGMVAIDRPRTRLSNFRLNRSRTRTWNTIRRLDREIGYRIAIWRYNRGVAAQTIDPAVTPAPVRNFPGIWRI